MVLSEQSRDPLGLLRRKRCGNVGVRVGMLAFTFCRRTASDVSSQSECYTIIRVLNPYPFSIWPPYANNLATTQRAKGIPLLIAPVSCNYIDIPVSVFHRIEAYCAFAFSRRV